MVAIVITSCSNRKRVPPAANLRAANLPSGRIARVAELWLARVAQSHQHTSARRLYCGRAFTEAVMASKAAGGLLFVVSAGLGLIASETFVPSYSLTVSDDSADNVLRRFTDSRSLDLWWRHVSAGSKFGIDMGTLLAQHPNQLVLLALPSAYLSMVQDEFLCLPESEKGRLRFFTRCSDSIADKLCRLVMPYDARFDGPDSPVPGTRSDFAQRAVRHFAEVVLRDDPNGTVERHSAAVNASLRHSRVPQPINRTRLTDEQILNLIGAHWDATRGRSNLTLRFLRDELGVACEQGRFSILCRQVRKNREVLQ